MQFVNNKWLVLAKYSKQMAYTKLNYQFTIDKSKINYFIFSLHGQATSLVIVERVFFKKSFAILNENIWLRKPKNQAWLWIWTISMWRCNFWLKSLFYVNFIERFMLRTINLGWKKKWSTPKDVSMIYFEHVQW